ncbi:MAG TPA: hypothetical protein VMX17_14630 [Candidatus Glassbacteria bacterium]|nr:hypothetical protein [Candidatus Glassbacteria bacterium]
MEKTLEEKKHILLKHYAFEEICEILGYYDGSNETVATPEMEKLEAEDYPAFHQKILEEASKNGNFEECIEHDCRFAL